jgi:hypothetical protein
VQKGSGNVRFRLRGCGGNLPRIRNGGPKWQARTASRAIAAQICRATTPAPTLPRPCLWLVLSHRGHVGAEDLLEVAEALEAGRLDSAEHEAADAAFFAGGQPEGVELIEELADLADI